MGDRLTEEKKNELTKEEIGKIHQKELLSSIINRTIDDILTIINKKIDTNNSNIYNSINLDDFLDSYPDVRKFKGKEQLTQSPYFWNNSFSDLIELFNGYYSDDNKIFSINIGENGEKRIIYQGDIKRADAQYQNSKNQGIESIVMPKINGNGQYYFEVRSEDLSLYTADNTSNLLYSNSKKRPYGRLLLPKNSRRVNIEDLNKNFWVISQLTSLAVQALLNSGVNQILNGIIKELVKLWNNIIMMWIALYRIYDQMPQVYILPITNNPYCIDKRYDDFSKLEELEQEKLDEVIELQCKLFSKRCGDNPTIIIPEIRLKNYSKNYYSKILIDRYYIWDKGALKRENIDEDRIINISLTAKDSGPCKEDYLWGFNDQESYLWIYYPFSRKLKEDERKRLYKDLAEKNQNLDEKDRRFTFNFYCGYRPFFNVKISRDEKFNLYIESFQKHEGEGKNEETKEEDVIERILGGDIDKSGIPKKLSRKSGNNLGFYLGEVLSACREINLADLKEEEDGI